MKKPLWWIRLTQFEYWSFWVFYAPAVFYGLYLAIKARSLLYFSNLNPCMEFGGVVGDDKAKILAKIPQEFVPKTLFFPSVTSLEEVLSRLAQDKINFPIIVKPNKGERGTGVKKITSEKELAAHIEALNSDFLVQEFITYPVELGVMYFRMPDGSASGITSIVHKKFLSVTGDGKATLAELVERYDRARFQKARLAIEFADKWESVIAQNEKLLLEPIGNHCRGTTFLNGCALINEKAKKTFDAITQEMPGFYYGRFDIKVPAIEDFLEGKHIKIMEVNGVASEPAHIYDPENSLFSAYKDVFFHMKLIYQICKQNKKRGYRYATFDEFWRFLKCEYFGR